jgi:dTDP-4-dehydrorhamnose reductase
MRILLLGKYGQLGYEMRRCLAPLGQVTALDVPEINLAEAESIRQVVRDTHPQVIVNATAYTAVDQAESAAWLANAINADSPRVIAEEAAAQDAALIHFSTDYVFDGTKGSLYTETDQPNPLGVYGSSKLAGEKAIQKVGGAFLIFRTSWVYSLRRDSFVTKVLHWSRQNPSLKVVSDQVSNPTWARMLAEVSALLLAKAGDEPQGWIRERCGLYHLAGSGYASRLDWAKEILLYDPKPEEQISREILPARTEDFPTPARRPLFSALDCSLFRQTFQINLPPWQESLRLAMES